jgi:hypothetical protein
MVNSAVANVGTRRPIKPVPGAAKPPEPKVTGGVYSQNSTVAVDTGTTAVSMAVGVDPVEANGPRPAPTGTFDPGRRGACRRAWRWSSR